MSSRETILAAIRASLAPAEEREAGRLAANARMAEHPAGIIPATPAEREALLQLFCDKVVAAAASVERAGRDEVVGRVSEWLRQRNLPQSLRSGSDGLIASLDWEGSGVEIATGRSDGSDLNGIGHALAGVAETGTLVMVSGPENPTTLNFLPENHIVLVEAADVLGSLEGAMARIRALPSGTGMPRTVNFITGPSRSADIEQTLILGAHGPVRLHVIVVEG